MEGINGGGEFDAATAEAVAVLLSVGAGGKHLE